MKYHVYHAKQPTFGFGDPQPFDEAHFDLVAEVECEGHGEAFRLTNHIDDDWYDNPEVRVIRRSRSTSVGDVVERLSDGKRFRCEMVGWSDV